MTAFIKTTITVSDDQMNIDKCRLAANITEYHSILKMDINIGGSGIMLVAITMVLCSLLRQWHSARGYGSGIVYVATTVVMCSWLRYLICALGHGRGIWL